MDLVSNKCHAFTLSVISVGDGGGGGREHVPPKNSGKIFFGQLSCKIGEFC